jgi:hypothetical protein
MWIRSLVGISGNEVTDGLARQAVESGTVHGQMVVANDHRIFVRQAMVSNGKQCQHVWWTGDTAETRSCASEVGSIEVMPQFSKGMWSENMREIRPLNGLMLEVQRKLEPSYLF